MAPLYEYHALNKFGKKVQDLIEAENPKAARIKLKSQQLMVVDITEKKASEKKALSSVNFFSGVSTKDMALLTKQLSSLIKANIPLVESLSAVADQTENKKLAVVLSQVRQDVNEGVGLAKALSAHPRIFDTIFVSMVESGESSGNLFFVLKKLSELKESQMRLKSQVVSATTYPALMMIVSFSLMIGIFTFVIPKMTRIFESSKMPIPFVTRFLISLSDVIVKWFFVFFIAGIFSLIFFLRYIRTPAGKAKWDVFLMRLPVIGNIIRLVATTRFCSTMATLLASGVPILVSLQIAKNIVDNAPIAKAIQDARDNITEGQSIADPLRRSGQFPAMMIHMIATGEKTGDLPPMLESVANIYENQVAESVEAFTSLLEPMMIVGMGFMVAIIVIAVLLPMLDMMNLAQR
jgi:general secretion pathway protein F